ncbi:tripartite tricarboxylate transporter TctB family protein [Pseudooceanicola marinus]|uniref:tripartite tricarboxylate transporter TctB family protein n=1 Tax=Pseudooceanicola marinus TaxID=396013 RepID=UPI001C987F80|nr:tripartite tricarboxylate transporter TctB family protein [Pseudooceanicola marinus]MBY5972935.1 tripartite tricarboxylate transporter TctB family protein [Ferrimonas balearica]MCA1336790.1 tripartite tricarboxylate transporter TctB family protein [Pseudooceanicola marinus]
MASSPAFSFRPGPYLPGVVVILTGAAVAAGALNYPLGSVLRPGPGFFPLGLSVLLMLMGLGVLIEARATARAAPTDTPEEPFHWGALIGTVVSILAFGLSVERIGFIPATLLLFAICAAFEGGRDWRRLALAALFIAGLGTAVFLWGLGLPLSAFGGA